MNPRSYSWVKDKAIVIETVSSQNVTLVELADGTWLARRGSSTTYLGPFTADEVQTRYQKLPEPLKPEVLEEAKLEAYHFGRAKNVGWHSMEESVKRVTGYPLDSLAEDDRAAIKESYNKGVVAFGQN